MGFLQYRASSVLFQIFCDYQILKKVPRKAFLPWDNTREFKANALSNKVRLIFYFLLLLYSSDAFYSLMI